MTLKELLYPPRCLFCGKIRPDGMPCEDCLKSAVELTATVCTVCGNYPENCKCSLRSFAFRRNVSCFEYAGGPRTMVLRYKQRYKPQLADFMSRRMYHHLRVRLGEEFDCITFVPQSYRSWVRRGFYPTKELAERLGIRMNLPVRSLLRRVGDSQQKYIRGGDRWANARKNYELLRDAKISGRVLLIDDLFTSGATLNACAELLRQAGAEEVCCCTFAISAKKS